MGDEKVKKEGEEEEGGGGGGNAGRCLFKTRTQHHRMVGKKQNEKQRLRPALLRAGMAAATCGAAVTVAPAPGRLRRPGPPGGGREDGGRCPAPTCKAAVGAAGRSAAAGGCGETGRLDASCFQMSARPKRGSRGKGVVLFWLGVGFQAGFFHHPLLAGRGFFNTRSPEVPTLSPGPVFHPESFFDGPGAR